MLGGASFQLSLHSLCSDWAFYFIYPNQVKKCLFQKSAICYHKYIGKFLVAFISPSWRSSPEH